MKTSHFPFAQNKLRKELIKWQHFLCLSSALFVFHGLFATQMPHNASSINQSTYTASIERVWAEHNQIQEGQKGVVIHVAFNADNSRGKQCSVVAYFHDENGRALMDQNGEYVSSVGTVSTIERFTPNYHNSHYSDYPLFIPYAELHIEGSRKIIYHVMVRTGDGRSARSASFSFQLNLGRTPSQENGSLSCMVDCRKDGYPCTDFAVRLVGDGKALQMEFDGAGRATFNNLLPGNYQATIFYTRDSKKGDDITAGGPRFNRSTQGVSIESGQRKSIRFE